MRAITENLNLKTCINSTFKRHGLGFTQDKLSLHLNFDGCHLVNQRLVYLYLVLEHNLERLKNNVDKCVLK